MRAWTPSETLPAVLQAESCKDGAAGPNHLQEGDPIRNGVDTEESRGEKCKDEALGLRLSPARSTPDLFNYTVTYSLFLFKLVWDES